MNSAFLFVAAVGIALANDAIVDLPRTETAYGPIEGISLKQGKVNAFLGIPYARPPLKERRFSLPLPPEPWKTVRATKHWSRKCLPFRRNFESLEGYSEDCLYLSILTPAQPVKTNLLVFFSNEHLNVVRIMDVMRKEVAVAVVHMREGFQGYAALDGENGGHGIADITLALDFLEDNAHAFGVTGKIVLAAENDAASALHAAFDPWKRWRSEEGLTRDYQLVLLGGNKLSPRFSSNVERTVKNTRLLLREIDCDLPSSVQTLDCARSKSYTDLLRAYMNLQFNEEYGAPFRPTFGASEIVSPVRTIVGLDNGLPRFLYEGVDDFNSSYSYENFKTFLARIISDKEHSNGALVRRLIWHEYVLAEGDKKDTYFLWQQSRKILYDKIFMAPTTNLLPLLRPHETLIYLFKYDVPNPISTCLSAALPEFQEGFCEQWWKFVLRFTTKGEPTQRGCEEGKPKWPALKQSKRDYYIILHEDGKNEWEHNFGKRAEAFWNQLVPLIENLQLAGKRAPASEDDIELVHPLEEEDDQQQYHQPGHDEF